ncbi:hypothetical protein D3C73_1419560 [compost metagenome]
MTKSRKQCDFDCTDYWKDERNHHGTDCKNDQLCREQLSSGVTRRCDRLHDPCGIFVGDEESGQYRYTEFDNIGITRNKGNQKFSSRNLRFSAGSMIKIIQQGVRKREDGEDEQ